MLLGVKNNTCNLFNAIYAETGHFSVVIQYKIRIVKYWHKLTGLEYSKIVKQVYNYLLKSY